MGLLVPEGPPRRQLGKPGDAGVLAHDDDGVLRRHDEDVEGKSDRGRHRVRAVDQRCSRRGEHGRRELPLCPGAIECAIGLVNEQRPSVGADEPLDRGAGTVGGEPIAALAVAHLIGRALAVELGSAFTQPEERALGEEERHARRDRVQC